MAPDQMHYPQLQLILEPYMASAFVVMRPFKAISPSKAVRPLTNIQSSKETIVINVNTTV